MSSVEAAPSTTASILVLDDAMAAPTMPQTTPTSAASSPDMALLAVEGPMPGQTCFSVQHGMRFVAGRLEFSLTALPIELLYTLRMFAATKKGDLSELKSIVESSKNQEFVVPYVTISQQQQESSNANRFSTISVASSQGVDVNVQYQPPSYMDDVFFGQNFNRRRSSAHMVRTVTILSPMSPPAAGAGAAGGCGLSVEEHKLLLHIAIEKNHVEIVTYLLSQNADVCMYVVCG